VLKRSWEWFWSLRWYWKAGLSLIVVVIAVSSGDSENEGNVAAPGRQVASQTTTNEDDESTTAQKCTVIPERVLGAIEDGLKQDARRAGVQLVGDAFVLKSGIELLNGDEVWFIAAEIDGAGYHGGGDVGVWATNGDPSKPRWSASLYRANERARRTTTWGAAASPTSEVYFDESDLGVAAAEACLR
jgi:hypothetical protein